MIADKQVEEDCVVDIGDEGAGKASENVTHDEDDAVELVAPLFVEKGR